MTMVPDKFNMVDMGGIDLLSSNGQVVSGLYEKILEAYSPCKICVLYNYSFGTLPITPQYTFISLGDDEVILNGTIHVSSNDIVTLPSISVSDYNALENKPKINNVELIGDLSLSDLGITYSALFDKPTLNNVTLEGDLVSSDLGIPEITDVVLTTSPNVTFGGSSLKIGSCVIISGRFNFSSATGWRTMATIPEAVAPPSTVGFMAGHGGNTAIRDGSCTSSGNIQIYTENSDTYLIFTLIYLLS